MNPNITWEIIKNNPDKNWDWSNLSRNWMCYNPYFQSDHYRKKQLKQFWDASKEEFIARTWHPDRVLAGWCLDEDERRERFSFYGI